MANANGVANAGMYAATAGLNGIPAAGHYSDMQTLMQNMETLSGWLQQNREDFIRVQEGLEHVERRNARAVQPATNGETTQEDDQTPTISALRRSLDTANTTIAALETSHEQQLRLQSLYEDTLTEATERIRNYVFQQNEHLAAVHKHYASLLATSRQETLAAQQVHMEWQAGLSRLDGELKRAVEARQREKSPYRKRLAGLKAENAALRRMVGWEPAPEDDEGDEEDAVLEREVVTRGREPRHDPDARGAAHRESVMASVMNGQDR